LTRGFGSWFLDGMKTIVLACFLICSGLVTRAGEMRCKESDSAIEIRCGERLVLRYNKEPTAEAAENDPVYSRTGYIHPLCTPSGTVVTGDYAADHPHQHGLFFAWTKTSFEGRSPEFWNQRKEAGRVSYVKTLDVVSGGEKAGFDVEHLFEDLTAPGGPKPVLKETWRVRARKVDDHYEVDIESVQTCATDSPLTIERYHYGGMAIRGRDEWLDAGDRLLVTSEGKGREAGNHTRPEWVRMEGEIDGRRSGVLAIPDPGNFRHPQWVRLHPGKPYFVFAPMVEEAFTIEPGERYVSRFRYVTYDGERPEVGER